VRKLTVPRSVHRNGFCVQLDSENGVHHCIYDSGLLIKLIAQQVDRTRHNLSAMHIYPWVDNNI